MNKQIKTGNLSEAITSIDTQSEKSGLFDLPDSESCRDLSHEIPSHMVIPFGKGYRHVCPSCGKVTVIIPPQVSL